MYVFIVEQPMSLFQVGTSSSSNVRMGFSPIANGISKEKAEQIAEDYAAKGYEILRFKNEGYGHLTPKAASVIERVAKRVVRKTATPKIFKVYSYGTHGEYRQIYVTVGVHLSEQDNAHDVMMALRKVNTRDRIEFERKVETFLDGYGRSDGEADFSYDINQSTGFMWFERRSSFEVRYVIDLFIDGGSRDQYDSMTELVFSELKKLGFDKE